VSRRNVITLIIFFALGASEPNLGNAQSFSQYKDALLRKGSASEISAAADEFEALLKVKAEDIRQSVGNNKMCMVHIFREQRDSLGTLAFGDHFIVDVGTISNQVQLGDVSRDKRSIMIRLRTADGAPTALRIFSATKSRPEGSDRVAAFFVSVPAPSVEGGIPAGVVAIQKFSSLCAAWW